eukprot:scaffold213996_cov30-Tisochrysis_lutea.AAC.1
MAWASKPHEPVANSAGSAALARHTESMLRGEFAFAIETRGERNKSEFSRRLRALGPVESSVEA